MSDYTQEVVITRIFNAPRQLVYEAWTKPEHLAQWWGPHGFTNPHVTVDLRPGGVLLIHMAAPDGTVYPMRATFQEVVPPERLVFISTAFEDDDGVAHLEVLNTVTFTALGDQTELVLRAKALKVGPMALQAIAGMEMGWMQSLEKLADWLLSGSTKG